MACSAAKKRTPDINGRDARLPPLFAPTIDAFVVMGTRKDLYLNRVIFNDRRAAGGSGASRTGPRKTARPTEGFLTGLPGDFTLNFEPALRNFPLEKSGRTPPIYRELF